MRPAFLALTVAFVLAGCSSSDQGARAADDRVGMAASWTTDATELRGRSGTYAFDCPPNDGRRDDVWGSNPYTDDSSVCWAGVHAGVITAERGGRVTIEPRPGQDRYSGSTRNGVETLDYPSWLGSFAVVE